MNAVTSAEPARKIFDPRRLAHVNVYVSDYEHASDFYRSIVGFNEAYRQPDNLASFMSNGNTYHDFGLTSVASKYAKAGQKPGLFHIALEVENEAELVENYNRAVKAGLNFRSTVDHDVAHSLYLYDPEGNILEIYADVVDDWKILRSGTVTKAKPKWVPGVSTVPVTAPLYPANPELAKVQEAVFHGKRVTHVALATANYEELVRYYSGPIGLALLAGSESGPYAVLKGHASNGDLTLLRAQPGLEPGLHHTGIEVWSEDELASSLAEAKARGIEIERVMDHPARIAVTIRDPDGMRLQFYVNRNWQPDAIGKITAADAPYLL
jgi:catechol 2,3-dioxygenase